MEELIQHSLRFGVSIGAVENGTLRVDILAESLFGFFLGDGACLHAHDFLQL